MTKKEDEREKAKAEAARDVGDRVHKGEVSGGRPEGGSPAPATTVMPAHASDDAVPTKADRQAARDEGDRASLSGDPEDREAAAMDAEIERRKAEVDEVRRAREQAETETADLRRELNEERQKREAIENELRNARSELSKLRIPEGRTTVPPPPADEQPADVESGHFIAMELHQADDRPFSPSMYLGKEGGWVHTLKDARRFKGGKDFGKMRDRLADDNPGDPAFARHRLRPSVHAFAELGDAA